MIFERIFTASLIYATIRSATSRWNISVADAHHAGHGSARSQPTSSGVATL